MLLTTLIPRIQMQATSVPDNMALLQMQETARRFFRRTKVWTAELTLDAVADQSAYELDVSAEVDAGTTPKVSRIQRVTLNGSKVSEMDYTLRNSDGYLVFETGATPSEALTDGIVVTVVMVPAIDGTDFPQEYVEKYIDGIVGGTLERLMVIPDRPYTNPGLARTFAFDYARAITRAEMDINSEGTERSKGFLPSQDNTGTISG
jgi:hypothetical protein